MLLIPSAKPIRIRILSGGEEHSSLDTLMRNFSIQDLRPLVEDGRLVRWLKQKGETKTADRIADFKFQSFDTYPNEEEALEFITIFFPEFMDKPIDKVWEVWDTDPTYEDNRKYLNKYLRRYPAIQRVLEQHKRKPEYYSKEDWIEILKQEDLKEVLKLLRAGFHETIGLEDDDLYTILSSHADNTQDAESIFHVALYLSCTDDFKKQGEAYMVRSANKGYARAKDYVNSEKNRELLESFPNATVNLSLDVQNSTDFLRFLTVMEKMSKWDSYLSQSCASYKGRYKEYLLLCEDLWNYRWLSTDKMKREYIKRIKERNCNAAKDISKAFADDINGDGFSKLPYREYLQYIIDLVKKYEFNEK